MANDAAGNGAEFAVPGHMARHASDDSAFDASLCFDGGGSEHNAEDGNSWDQRLHAVLLKKNSLQQFALQPLVPEHHRYAGPTRATLSLSVSNIAAPRNRATRFKPSDRK
jgi:hypothetical protein